MRLLLPSNSFTRPLHAIVDFVAIACGWWLLGLSILTCVEMLGRKVFGFSLQGVDEIGSYTFAAVGAFGFSYTLITCGHTRVDFLLSRFSEAQRAVLNFAAMLTLAVTAVFFTYRAYHVLMESVDLRSTAASPLGTPLWLPQSIWLLGYVVFSATALAGAGYATRLLLAGAWTKLNARYGPQTLEEEIESESTVHIDRRATASQEMK
ncbi:TRAP transporter small permease subunit [Bradyrhizobium erythrophlei]|uniref:TRAP transporter small permease subunit n=1 Tax=Bradyrhizobium erythrophlei TaxID=1437360 RepID=UPI0035EF754A